MRFISKAMPPEGLSDVATRALRKAFSPSDKSPQADRLRFVGPRPSDCERSTLARLTVHRCGTWRVNNTTR
jgi:hypothetical protein